MLARKLINHGDNRLFICRNFMKAGRLKAEGMNVKL
jgi:hypothetical protein